jgi:hypothetical protein
MLKIRVLLFIIIVVSVVFGFVVKPAVMAEQPSLEQTAQSSQDKAMVSVFTISGKLIKVVAIGGETTGWAVDLELPLGVEGQQLSRIEVDPGNIKIARFKDKRIEVIGALERRQGVERGYYVIMIEKICELVAEGAKSK